MSRMHKEHPGGHGARRPRGLRWFATGDASGHEAPSVPRRSSRFASHHHDDRNGIELSLMGYGLDSAATTSNYNIPRAHGDSLEEITSSTSCNLI